MKRAVSIQDISCVGKCSQTIALPILSAMGIETSILPTAILSTHTMFSNYTFHDLTDQITPISNHWKSEGINFDAILSGYLGTLAQIDLVAQFYEEFLTDDTITVVDPVFADNGKIYPGFNENYATSISKLCCKAKFIVPNITEAAFMAKFPYKLSYSEQDLLSIAKILQSNGAKNIIITSIIRKDQNGIFVLLEDGETFEIFRTNTPGIYHGTGDLFASTLTGALLLNYDVKESAEIAVEYVYETLIETYKNKSSHWYGVNFECTLPALMKRLGRI